MGYCQSRITVSEQLAPTRHNKDSQVSSDFIRNYSDISKRNQNINNKNTSSVLESQSSNKSKIQYGMSDIEQNPHITQQTVIEEEETKPQSASSINFQKKTKTSLMPSLVQPIRSTTK